MLTMSTAGSIHYSYHHQAYFASKMEALKENLLAKYFSPFGYIVAISHVPALVSFVAGTGTLRTSERRRFSCPSYPDSRDDCLGKYDEHFNSPLPLYGFVPLCFVPLLAVCIAYSWCFVKSRVDELEIALKGDPENPSPRREVTTSRVFCAYFVHLLVRFFWGILFVVLQRSVFYSSGFPAEFVCVPTTVNPTVNWTNFDASKHHSSAINCDNSVASDNTVCAMAIYVVNILIALLVFGEICYLSVHAIQRKEFTFDSEFVRNHFLKKGGIPVGLPQTTLSMKRRIRQQTERLKDRLLDDMFVDPVIYTERARHEFKNFLKRHEIFDIYLKPEDESITIEKLDELFIPNKDTENPCKILVVGRPGIGKSLLCQKLSRDWSKTVLLRDNDKHFQHLFLFQFRSFNTEPEKISLKQLLNSSNSGVSIDNEVFQYILDNPEKVLLVFDGLDEFKHHERFAEVGQQAFENSAIKQMPFSALYVKLMKGHQLCGATVLTTCRPNVVHSVLPHLKFDREVEIMGFTPQKVQEYVQKSVRDAETANRIWCHISNNLELLSLCYIPVNSFIICSILEECIKLQEQNPRSTLPSTSTEVYEKALRLFLFKHHPECKILTEEFLMENVGFPDTVEKTLSEAGALAKTGIEERRLVFNKTEVQGMENCGLFNRMPGTKIADFTIKSQFCFIHLTFQECLAAREITKMEPRELSDFIRSNTSDPKWHMVLQFVAGLLRSKESEAVNTFISILCDSLTEDGPQSKTTALLMMKCLHEYNNEATVEKAASELQKSSKFDNKINLSGCQVTPVDCAAIVYIIKHLQDITQLELAGNNVKDQGVLHLCDALKDEHCKLAHLGLFGNSITDQGLSHLYDALKDEHCKLTQLDLACNSITDQGVSHLCDALKDEHCKLTQLDLGLNSITDKGVSHLCDALKDEHCKLTQLYLAGNSITDQGVSHLCDALKDEHCKLTQLYLAGNSITDQDVSHLCDALKDEHCKLTQLDLGLNSITDQGVSHLCDALKDEHCKLTQLYLAQNSITDQGVSHLCDALKDEHCKLTQLYLAGNSITDQGVSHLCDAIKDEHCKLTQLDLSGNSITDQGVSHLCDALKDEHCKLTQLDLAGNSITDQDVSHLCDALKDEHCKLTQLDLACNSMTDQDVTHLCDALKDEHCKLTQLDLACNSITDQGVSHLCDALKDEHCKLTQLDLGLNSITDQGVSHLCDALKDEHCKLTQLYLAGNSITDHDVSHLCDAIKDEHCKLTQLYLAGNSITDQDVSHLCDALKDEHCKLTQLDLSGNSITDQGVSHLCDALKDEHCKLTQLYLAQNSITDQAVLHLCDALKDGHCKLTQLNLAWNSITEQGVSHLCDALKDEHCKLTQLNLFQNSITDQGVSHLCDGLKDEHCKLTQLYLAGNSITDQGVSHLCVALKDEHCKLTQLYLAGNSITDQGVLHLCDALKDEHCKVTQLDLPQNSITDQGVLHLCDALKDGHCKLTQLNLAWNSITEQGVSHLCDTLKDEHCKLTQLNLFQNSITDQGVSHLCDALKDEHCKLTQLYLAGNNITDQGVSHLCVALKDEHCKLTQLYLAGNSITDQGVLHLCDALKDEHCKLTQLDLAGNSITD